VAKKAPGKTKSGAVPTNSAELDRLEKILGLMARHGVAELEWEKSGERLRLCTQSGIASAAPQIAAPAPSAPVAAPTAAPAAKPAAQPSNHKQVVSPFVGTFYRSPSPTAEPYVREGQSVKRGDVLCIIEAMKLMNEIEVEFSGKIVSVLAENGQPVEFGEPLFVVET
jgi:acetyl-CoA carboxylase biotin carboxyl carrier protein